MGKATKGSFYSNGRRKQPSTKAERMAKVDANKRVLPTPETVAYVERRVEYWTHPGVWNRAAAEQGFDNAGILWLTEWFNGHGFMPDEIRNIFRTYAELYWSWYPAPKTSKAERVGKSEPRLEKTKREALFMKLDARLKMGSNERKAVHDLAVNDWHSDEFFHRAVRLSNTGRLKINTRLKGAKLPIAGELATARDTEWLEDALRGAFMMLDERTAHRQWDRPLWALNDEGDEEKAA